MFEVSASDDKDNAFESGPKVDPAQMESFEQIRNLLVAGGYFRAMIKTLDHFDKVAGGLAWSITAANESVDINLLFEEHSRMGEKITMSENIERALVDMECPHPLQAQQILHLDCINIFPVVRWLVSKVIEVRQQTGDLVRAYSEKQFRTYDYQMPADAQYEATKPGGLEYITDCNNIYTPKRTQRLKAQTQSLGNFVFEYRCRRYTKAHENEVVHSAMIEYGQAHLYTMALLQKRDEKEKPSRKPAANSKIKLPVSEEEEAVREAENAKAQENKILKLMQKTHDDPSVGNSALSKIFKAQSAEIEGARVAVAEELTEAQELSKANNEKEQGGFKHESYIKDVESKIAKAQKKLAKLQAVFEEKQESLKSIQAAYTKKIQYNQKIIDETEKLNALEQTPESKKNQQILQELVRLNQNLKDQKAQLKTAWSKELEDWKKQIEELKNLTPDDGGRGDQILTTYDTDKEKLEKLKELFAKKNREIASVKRKIDQVPSRRELQQYQRQFIEVFEQMGVKYTETKQYINTFNSSEKIRAALDHESKLLDSIQEKYPTIKNSKPGREKFLASLKEILEGMEKRLDQQKKLLDEEIAKRNELDEQYIALTEKERLYYASAKEYQEECKKTESLEEKLRKIQKKKKK